MEEEDGPALYRQFTPDDSHVVTGDRRGAMGPGGGRASRRVTPCCSNAAYAEFFCLWATYVATSTVLVFDGRFTQQCVLASHDNLMMFRALVLVGAPTAALQWLCVYLMCNRWHWRCYHVYWAPAGANLVAAVAANLAPPVCTVSVVLSVHVFAHVFWMVGTAAVNCGCCRRWPCC